jgi:hypothetical protein
MSELARLRVYRFDPGAVFRGELLSAIERMQLSGDVQLLDALFVRRDDASGALEAVDLASGGADATFATMLDFRLEPRRRRAITERTLTERRDGVPRDLIEAIAATLEAGAAIFAVLHTGAVAQALEDAVAACGGRAICAEEVRAEALADVGRRVRAAAGERTP